MKINETIRKDGLRIITVSLPNQRKVHVEIVCRVGSAYDPSDKRGLFHFFEHMAFKGTKRRSVEEIQSFSKHNLLELNATTGQLATTYYGVAVYTKFKKVCDLLFDIYSNSTFPAKELKKERGPVLLEIARSKDKDVHVAHSALVRELWRKNPMRLPGPGTIKGVHAVRRTDLFREKKRWNVPSSTVALAIGKVDHRAFVKEVNKHMPLRLKKVNFLTWGDEYAELPRRQKIVVKKHGRKKAIVMLGFKLPIELPERTWICISACLTQLLVSGSSSWLWKEVREKRGLAYSVDGGIVSTTGLGRYFFVKVETSPEHVGTVQRLIQKALTRPLTDKDAFEEMREHTLDWMTLGFEDRFDLYESVIWQKIGRNQSVKSTAQYLTNRHRVISSLSMKEVETVRKEFFRPERFVTVIVKPM